MSAPCASEAGRRSALGAQRRRASLALFFCALLWLAAVPAVALVLPTLSGRVVDEANILDPAARAALTQKLADLEAKTSDQLVVVTLRSLQGTSIEDFGVELGRRWRIGQQGKNNGVLLIVAPTDRKVRIEVGYGLEGMLTDAISKLIIENAIIPRFRANDVPGGVSRGVDDIISVLTGDAEEWKQRAAKRPDPTPPWGTIITLILALVVFGLVFFMIVGAMPSGPNNRRRRRSASPWSSGSSWWTGSSAAFPAAAVFPEAAGFPEVADFPAAGARSAAAARREAGEGSR